jgi:hypothetical protein
MQKTIKNLMRKLVTLPDKPERLKQISRGLTMLVNDVDAKVRICENQNVCLPDIQSYDKECCLMPCVRQKHTPWSSVQLDDCDTPGMVSTEECQYYNYIGKFYSGQGGLVELGPWLGRSTHYIIQGLETNPNFQGKKLHVYDDFVWRSHWMDDKVPEGERINHHECFQFLFEKYSSNILSKIHVEKRKITTYDGNDEVEQLVWNGRPIEIIYVDCGRTYEANEAWWQIFADSFLKDKTLIVLEDWDTHRHIPVQWFNQIKQWVDSKEDRLQLIHELEHGGIATFLYRG